MADKEKKDDLFAKSDPRKEAAHIAQESDSDRAKQLEKEQIEGAQNKAKVINNPSLAEQARQVDPGYPGWHKPASDLQEPGKVEGAVLTDDVMAKEAKKGRKPRYIAGHLEPIYIDEKKFDELQKKMDDVKLSKEYAGQENDIPKDHDYWKWKDEQANLLKVNQ